MAKKFILHIIIGMIVIAGTLACQHARAPEAESLYYAMTQQKTVMEFNEFPQAFISMKGHHNGTIFANEKDTLKLICSYPNIADEKNRYPFYFMEDNHGNSWTMIQEEERYKIFKNSVVEKSWFKSFCSGGASLTWMIIFVIMMRNLSAIENKDRITMKNAIILIILAFLLGGVLGLCLM